jgi:hypothetical protein
LLIPNSHLILFSRPPASPVFSLSKLSLETNIGHRQTAIRSHRESPSRLGHALSDDGLPSTPDINRGSLYKPLLHEGAIRVLEVFPGAFEDPLACKLRIVRLCSPYPYFDAISYCWEKPEGFDSKKKTLRCDGIDVEVGANLWDALRRLRKHGRSRTVWADALCIDQSNAAERSHQVRQMRSIYCKANKVVIWLGEDTWPPNFNASRAFDAMGRIATAWRLEHRHDPQQADLSTNEEFKDVAAPRLLLDHWWHILELFQSRWFQRLWVFQEVVLAKRAWVHIGPHTLSWDVVGLTAAIIRTNSQHLLEGNRALPEMPTGVVNAYLMYRMGNSHDGQRRLSFPFLELLNYTRQFQCQDPRDRVYGLLGIKITDADPENGDLFIQPDYSLSPERVFEEVGRKILANTETLDLFSSINHAAHIHRDSSGIPSWVPVWDSYSGRRLLPIMPSSGFAASSDKPRRITWQTSPSSCSLTVLGLQVDRVVGTSSILEESHFTMPARMLSIVFGDIEDPLQACSDPELETDPSKLKAIWSRIAMTLVAGKSWYGTSVLDEGRQTSSDFAAFHGQVMAERASLSPSEPVGWMGAGALAILQEHGREGDAARFVTAARQAMLGRRLFETESMAVGLGPQETQAGDVVCVLYGARIPFVLRQVGDFNTVVGECYVDSLMQGEAVRRFECGESAHTICERWFQLR